MQNGKLIIERKKRLSEAHYSVGIYIDGEFIVNTIKENVQEIELLPGIHILKVEQGLLSGEIEIEIKKGKVTTYEFSAKPLISANVAAFVIGAVLTNVANNVLFYIPFFLLLGYTSTIGRKSHFVFKKTGEDEAWLHDLTAR